VSRAADLLVVECLAHVVAELGELVRRDRAAAILVVLLEDLARVVHHIAHRALAVRGLPLLGLALGLGHRNLLLHAHHRLHLVREVPLQELLKLNRARAVGI